MLVALLLVAFNMRGAVAAIAPVLPRVQAGLGLSSTAAGLVTALPVVCFAAVAPAAVWLGRRAGLDRAVAVGLVLLFVGTVGRVFVGTAGLMIGTLVLGAGLTVSNVLLPAVVKRSFADRAGTVTGLYTAALCAGAGLTAAVTEPVAARAGWRFSLASWSALAIVALAVWVPAARRDGRDQQPVVRVPGGAADEDGAEADLTGRSPRSVWGHSVAWAVCGVLGAGSVTYYSLTAWLPTMLGERAGLDPAAAGLAMSAFQVLGIVGTLTVPWLALRYRRQRALCAVVALGYLVLTGGLLLDPQAWPLWVAIGGVTQGGGLALAMTLLVLRSRDARAARQLSGMAQLVGYGLGAVAPVAMGLLHDVTGGWAVPLGLMCLTGASLAVAGLVAGRDVELG